MLSSEIDDVSSMANARFRQPTPTNPTFGQGVDVVVVAVAVVVVVLTVVVVVVFTHVPQRTMHRPLKTVPMSPAVSQNFELETKHSSGSASPLHNVVEMPVFVVLVLVVEVVQLLHSTGQSLRAAAPKSGCKHCDTSTAPQNSGSGDPLQESVVVVVVVAVVVDAVVVDVAVVVVVLTVVVVVVSTQVPQRTGHIPPNAMPISPAASQYLYLEAMHSAGSSSPLHSLVVVVEVAVVVVDIVVVEVVQLSHSTGQSVRVASPNSGWKHCNVSIVPQISGSPDPLQVAVVVVVVVVPVVVSISQCLPK
jgi:hypothetical protein